MNVLFFLFFRVQCSFKQEIELLEDNIEPFTIWPIDKKNIKRGGKTCGLSSNIRC